MPSLVYTALLLLTVLFNLTSRCLELTLKYGRAAIYVLNFVIFFEKGAVGTTSKEARTSGKVYPIFIKALLILQHLIRGCLRSLSDSAQI